LLPASARATPRRVLPQPRAEVLDGLPAVVVPAALGALDAAPQVGDRQLGAAVELRRGAGHLGDEPFLVGGGGPEDPGELVGALGDRGGQVVGEEDLGTEPVLEGVAAGLVLSLLGARPAAALPGGGRAEGDVGTIQGGNHGCDLAKGGMGWVGDGRGAGRRSSADLEWRSGIALQPELSWRARESFIDSGKRGPDHFETPP
jgi:hypothetical protein